jgi:hypothetical protein
MNSPALTMEEKHQLLSVLRELDPKAPSEQRRAPRRKIHVEAPIRIIGPNPTVINSTIVNTSSSGAAVVINAPLAKKAKFLLPLRFCEGGGWMMLCEVRNCVPYPKRQWRIGARFLDHMDDPQGTAKVPLDWLL